MTADIIQFNPHKAKWIVDKYVNTGEVPIAKSYKSNFNELSKFLETLNASSDRKYEEKFVEIYQKCNKSSKFVANKDVENIKNEFTLLMNNLTYKKLEFSDNVIKIGDCDLESILYSLEKYRGMNVDEFPEYEKRILHDLRQNSKVILEALKIDADSIWEFMNKNEETIMSLSIGKTYMAFIMRIRETILEYAKIVNLYCT